jgi:hypothetical protein
MDALSAHRPEFLNIINNNSNRRLHFIRLSCTLKPALPPPLLTIKPLRPPLPPPECNIPSLRLVIHRWINSLD